MAGGRRGSAVSLTEVERDLIDVLKREVEDLCVGLCDISCPEKNYFDDSRLRESFTTFFGEFTEGRLRRFHDKVQELNIDAVNIIRLNSAGVAFGFSYMGANVRNTSAATQGKEIRLGDRFFEERRQQQILTLLHELTHACADTNDPDDGSLDARSTEAEIQLFARTHIDDGDDDPLNVAYCYEAFSRVNYELLMDAAQNAADSESDSERPSPCISFFRGDKEVDVEMTDEVSEGSASF